MRIVRGDGYRNCQADVLALLKEDIRCRQRALTKAVRERRLVANTVRARFRSVRSTC